MSRICVKNLPKNVKDDELKNFFSRKGEVTDAKLMRTTDGKSRNFGFIGYRTEQEAEEAIRYFNRSFMGACRITCEVAHKIGDPNIPRPWSRYSKEKEEKMTKEKKKLASDQDAVKAGSQSKNIKIKNIEEEDAKLKEFLQVMQPRSKSKLWADDTLVSLTDQDCKSLKKSAKSKEEGEKRFMPVSDNAIEDTSDDDVLDNDKMAKPSTLSRDEAISDADFFRSKVKSDWSDSENSDEGNTDEEDSPSNPENSDHIRAKKIDGEEFFSAETPTAEEAHEGMPDEGLDEKPNGESQTCRLFVRNLPYSATEDELEVFFSKFGNVAEVHIIVDKASKCSKGFAFVLYTAKESASRALEEADRSIFQGRLLQVMPAATKVSLQDQEKNIPDGRAKTFKQKREDKRKASEAGGDTQAWNSLFMRPDTVVENIARKYGIGKSDLLDREAGDLAVRMAAGETEVISETKKALASAGVNVGSLEEFATGKSEGTKRSNHVLLVKNLPYNSNEAELSEMFSRYGSVDKIILPPTKTLALVVYLESSEACTAFHKLAYKRYKDAPLYLEWAPNDILTPAAEPDNDAKNVAVFGQNEARKIMLQQQLVGASEAEIELDRVESRSLFVKNLNFKTTEETVRKHFAEKIKDGKILSVRIKKHVKNGKNLSMGFGFIEFDSAESAANVCKDLQGTVLDGHALILQLCHAKRDEKVLAKTDSDRSSTKLLVRNVAFEATEKELKQLFGLYGQIKRLTLPKKFGNHRGFAFVEYATKQEATKALQTLSNTHFYGRHLVLERAKEGESLEDLRARTAAQFPTEQNGFQSSTKALKKRKRVDAGDL